MRLIVRAKLRLDRRRRCHRLYGQDRCHGGVNQAAGSRLFEGIQGVPVVGGGSAAADQPSIEQVAPEVGVAIVVDAALGDRGPEPVDGRSEAPRTVRRKLQDDRLAVLPRPVFQLIPPVPRVGQHPDDIEPGEQVGDRDVNLAPWHRPSRRIRRLAFDEQRQAQPAGLVADDDRGSVRVVRTIEAKGDARAVWNVARGRQGVPGAGIHEHVAPPAATLK